MNTKLDRRHFLNLAGLTAGAVAAPAVIATAAQAAPDTSAITRALRGMEKLPGDVGYRMRVGGKRPFTANHRANARMFVGSAVKTFILTRYLKDIEKGRLDEAASLRVDDSHRMLSSSVFEEMTGKTRATSVLEAMITHSDNTATDIAMSEVGVERVRAFIASAGLTSVSIPLSTRHLFSYLAGERYGVDVGWEGMLRIADGKLFGKPRPPLNDRETMAGSAADFVDYYERILAGSFLRTPAMQREFRRISSMPRSYWAAAPDNSVAFGKGGSVEWKGFNCFCLPGQVVLASGVPVTFSFCVNWTGKPSTIPGVADQFRSTISEALAAAAKVFG